MSRRHLRAVNPNDTTSTQTSSGVSYRGIIIITVVTTVASQLVIDGYRAVKKWSKERREAAANPQPTRQPLPPPGMMPPQTMLSPPPPQVPMYAGPQPYDPMASWRGAPPPGTEVVEVEAPEAPEPPERPLNPDELAEWQRNLERKEHSLENWQRSIENEQRHLRLVGSG